MNISLPWRQTTVALNLTLFGTAINSGGEQDVERETTLDASSCRPVHKIRLFFMGTHELRHGIWTSQAKAIRTNLDKDLMILRET